MKGTILPQIYRHSRHYGLSSSRDDAGRSPLLIACSNPADVAPISDFVDHRIPFFLSNGSSVNEVDYNGRGCLHYILSKAIEYRRNPYKQLDTLVYLIRQGANVHATDYVGRSVSYLAYSDPCWAIDCDCNKHSDCARSRHRGNCFGDVWDAALDICDYSIAEFRKGFPRRARYTKRGSRKTFEKIWEGREQRCPYWDDVDWYSPGDEDHDNNGVTQPPVICDCKGSCKYEDSKTAYHTKSNGLGLGDHLDEDAMSEVMDEGELPDAPSNSPVGSDSDDGYYY